MRGNLTQVAPRRYHDREPAKRAREQTEIEARAVKVRSATSWLLLLFCLAAAAPAWALSLEEEVRLGRGVMAQVRHYGLTSDPSLNAIGADLSGVIQRQDLPWRFWVIENMRGYNAFAVPGGFVCITRAYYEKLNADEAAFVIGHEMAHIDLRHHERQGQRVRRAEIGRLLLDILTDGATGWRTAADLGATAYVTRYSRVLEREADFAGYGYAEAAGYDARMAVTALSKLGDEPNLHPWIQNIYATHPVLSSREDRLSALGGEEPEDIATPPPAASHRRDLRGGLDPFDPPRAIAVRILSPDGGRWENPWRRNFTRHLHLRLIPLGFEIAGDDIMYHREIGDPVETARSRDARYLLLVTVKAMESERTDPDTLAGTPVRATIDVAAELIAVADRSSMWQGVVAHQAEAVDALAVDPEILYTDSCLGALAERTAGEISLACARAAGAVPAKAGEQEARAEEATPAAAD